MTGSLTDSNPRAAQIRIAPLSSSRTSGLRNHELRIGYQPDYVDTSRTHLNRILASPLNGPDMARRAAELRARTPRQRAMKTNASVSLSGVITFGDEARVLFERLTIPRQDEAFTMLAHRVAKYLGTGLTGLVVHNDETSIHAHFQCDAYDVLGQAISTKTKRADLRILQDITFEVMSSFCPGIERGRSKYERLKAGAKPVDVVHRSPSAMREELAHMTATLDDLSRQVTASEAKRDKNLRLAEEARQKAESLAENEAKASAALKRAETYEKRARKAIQELEAIQKQLTDLTGQVTGLERLKAELEEQIAALRSRASVPPPELPDIPLPPLFSKLAARDRRKWINEAVRDPYHAVVTAANERAHACQLERDAVYAERDQLLSACNAEIAQRKAVVEAENARKQKAATENRAQSEQILQSARDDAERIVSTARSDAEKYRVDTKEAARLRKAAQLEQTRTSAAKAEADRHLESARAEQAEAAKLKAQLEQSLLEVTSPITMGDLPKALVSQAWDIADNQGTPFKDHSYHSDAEEWVLVGHKDEDTREGSGALAFLEALLGNAVLAIRLLLKVFDPRAVAATVLRDTPLPEEPQAAPPYIRPSGPGL